DNILELDSNFDDESVISMETNITNEIKLFEISEPTKSTKFTTCVLIDNFNGEIRSCGSSQNLHCIKNIFGTWEIDSEMVCKVNDDLASLGVCYSHQMYDQTKLHVKNAKGTKNSSLGFISNRRCLFCNINKTFYTRGEQCDQHSWTLVGRDLQVPCGGQYYCTSLTEIQPILYPSLSNKKSRYVCTSCYEKYGGHFHQRSGIKGKASLNCQKDSSHKNDAIESLHLIANWLLYVAKYESSNFQEQLSQEVINLLLFLPSSQKINHTSSTSISKESKPLNIIPSPFIIKAAFKLNKLDFFNYENKEFNEQESYEFANMKKSNNNTRDRVQNREREQHLLSSNIFTTQSLNSNTIVFNESQHSFSMPSNSNNSFNQNINNLNNNLQNIQLSSHTEIQNLSNIQAIHSPSGPVENSRPTKRIKRTTHMQELSFLEPLVNNTSEENISNAIQQLNSWNIENNHTENMWNRQRVIKWSTLRLKNFAKELILAEGFQFKGQKIIEKPYISKYLRKRDILTGLVPFESSY
ncbi:15594_t:CDS:2, partial [Funneliformis mosseae]